TQGGPAGSGLPAEPQYRAFGPAAEVNDVVGDGLRLRRQRGCPGRHAQRIEHALLEGDRRAGKAAPRTRASRRAARASASRPRRRVPCPPPLLDLPHAAPVTTTSSPDTTKQ